MTTQFIALLIAFEFIMAGCSTSFSLKIPKNAAAVYMECLSSPEGICRDFDQGTAAIQAIYPHDRVRTNFEPVSTAPRDDFINPFSEPKRLKYIPDGSVDSTISAFKAEAQAVDLVRSLLKHPIRAKIDDIFNAFGDPNPDLPQLVLDATSFSEYRKMIAEAAVSGAWEPYEFACRTNLINLLFKPDQTAADTQEVRRAAKDYAFASLAAEYFRAYFRNGQFAEMQLSLSDFVSKFPWLKDYPADVLSQIETALKKVDQKLKFGRISDEGFVTRFGAKYAFPPIELQFSPASARFAAITRLDYVTIGNDLIRIFIEALFDSISQLPAVSEATGVQKKLLPVFPDYQKYKHVSEDDFTSMNEKSNAAESGVASAVSRLIRGFSVFSTDNEAIETLIENALGVISRKAFEKLTWCWYSCGFPEVLSIRQSGLIDESYYPADLAAFPETGVEKKESRNPFVRPGPIGECRTVRFKINYGGL